MSHVFEICVLLLGVLRYSAVWLVGGLSLLCLETQRDGLILLLLLLLINAVIFEKLRLHLFIFIVFSLLISPITFIHNLLLSPTHSPDGTPTPLNLSLTLSNLIATWHRNQTLSLSLSLAIFLVDAPSLVFIYCDVADVLMRRIKNYCESEPNWELVVSGTKSIACQAAHSRNVRTQRLILSLLNSKPQEKNYTIC